jgi:two-component system LytT family response regulator
MQIRTVIADNDPTSRELLCSVLALDVAFEIVAKCESPKELEYALRTYAPDLAFVDVDIANLDRANNEGPLYSGTLSASVLITSVDKSTRPGDPQLLGQLVRPFTQTELLSLCQTCKTHITTRRVLDAQEAFLASLGRATRICQERRKLVVRSGGRIMFLRPDEIDWIEAHKNYVRVHVGPACITLRATLDALERTLDPSQFLRIHRSAIVNTDKIRELRPWPTGEYIVSMSNGKELTLSRGYRTRLAFLLKKHGQLDYSNIGTV